MVLKFEIKMPILIIPVYLFQTFKSSNSVKIHKTSVHSDIRDFKCDHCGKVLMCQHLRLFIQIFHIFYMKGFFLQKCHDIPHEVSTFRGKTSSRMHTLWEGIVTISFIKNLNSWTVYYPYLPYLFRQLEVSHAPKTWSSWTDSHRW